MTAAVLILVIMALVVAAVCAVRAYSINPTRLSKPLGRIRAGAGGASRRRVPQAIPPPAPRRDVSLDVQQLAGILRTHQWDSGAETPIAAELSAHVKHGYYHGCKVCTGDVTAISSVVLSALSAPAQVGDRQ